MPTLTAERPPAAEDLAYWESQFDNPDETTGVSIIPAPESEIYGRSLSTIRRLGALMVEWPSADIVNTPEADQARVEFFTSVQEGFGTDKELGGGLEVREFDLRPVIGGKVMAKDLKTAISDMTEAGLACAKETAAKDEKFLPQLTRSEWDHENALLVDKMARGETGYNVRLVVSPFPLEAAAQSGDAYWRNIGYVPSLRRGFVQLYCATKDGLVTGSLSFDGTDKARLRELFGEVGVNIPADEITDNWLKYAFTGTMSEEQAKTFATTLADKAGDPRYKKTTNTVDVTKQYGPIMERAFAESYVHICESLVRGRQTPGARALVHQLAGNAHNFNDRYSKALYKMRANTQEFTGDDSIVLHELLVYSTIEMMRALHLQKIDSVGNATDGVHVSAADLEAADAASFQGMLGDFGADGAKNNRGYSACGIQINLGDGKQEPWDNPQAVFGGMDKGTEMDEDRLGNRWFTCPKGHLNYRRKANVPELVCRSCKADVSCAPPEEKPEKAEQSRRVWMAFMEFGAAKRADTAPKVGKLALNPFA